MELLSIVFTLEGREGGIKVKNFTKLVNKNAIKPEKAGINSLKNFATPKFLPPEIRQKLQRPSPWIFKPMCICTFIFGLITVAR